MADSKVSALSHVTPKITDEWHIAQSGSDYKGIATDYLSMAGITHLSSDSAVDDTTISVGSVPYYFSSDNIYIIIDPFTNDCEIRLVTNVSGTTLTISALEYAHSSGDAVLWADRPVANVKLFGATGDNSTDDSTALQRALDQANGTYPVYIPLGDYKVKNITIPNRSRIYCDYEATIKGVASTDDIFTASSALTSILISGGTWTSCQYVINKGTAGSLNSSLFENMLINSCTAGFYMNSSVSNLWKNCNFGGRSSSANINYGIRMDGSAASNFNKVVDCEFRYTKNYGISFDEGASTYSQNVIVRCIFENVGSGGGINSGPHGNLVVRDCYFEKAGDDTTPDINLSESDGQIKPFVVDGCKFATATSGQVDHRINLSGLCAGIIRDCDATLVADMNFVEAGHQSFNVKMFNNYLAADAVGDYEDRLFNLTSTGTIDYNVFVNSGGVTGDSEPRYYTAGRRTSAIYTFTANDATPSVAEGDIYKTANTAGTTVTDFNDGKTGQTIKVIIADGNTTIDFTGTSLKGNGGADWTPANGDHMTCVYDGTNWYCDISDNT